MSTYRKIHGRSIQAVSTDPTESVAEGQIWYNTTSDTFKTVLVTEAWASQGPLISARYSGAGFGVSTAAVYAGGANPSGASTSTFEYNGSGWSSGGALNTGRWEMGGLTAGTETAGLCFGGRSAPGAPGNPGVAQTEEYNGTSWSTANNLATTVMFMGGSGIQTAAFSAGGASSGSNTNNSQEYDGTNWSNGNNINTTRQSLVGLGTQTAGMVAAGESPSGGSNSSETYDGTNWTAAPNLGTARYRVSGSGSDYTQGLVFGGRFNPPAADKAQTESFDGTSWTETADLATARQQLSGNRGTSSSAIAAGGLPPPASATADTEEFTKSANVITAAAWASGDNMNTGSYNPAALVGGTQTAVIAAGGDTGGPAYSTTKSEEYDGSSWTATPTLNTARAAGTGTGTSTASIVFGAYPPSNAPATESWNGSSWTTTPATVGAPMERAGGSGTQTAALAFAYYNRPGNSNPTTVYSYNGSSWTTSPATMNTGRYGASGVGTQTAALAMGGITVSPAAQSAAVEQWDGSSWTTKSSLTTARGYGGASGTYTSAIFFGGNPPSPTTATEGWDGTSWSTRPSMATTRAGMGSSGTSADAGIAYGGGSQLTATEEFTGESSALNVKTLTQS